VDSIQLRWNIIIPACLDGERNSFPAYARDRLPHARPLQRTIPLPRLHTMHRARLVTPLPAIHFVTYLARNAAATFVTLYVNVPAR